VFSQGFTVCVGDKSNATDVEQPGRDGVDLVVQVENHPAVISDTKARAEELRLQLEAHLEPTQIDMAQARAGKQTFESVVQELLR
jgi:hypothetical protein